MGFRRVSEMACVTRLVTQSYATTGVQWVHSGALARLAMLGNAPSRLLIAPQDLRIADPVIAADIYAGRFLFVGQNVETHNASPFEAPAPSEEWSKALHGFSWLRHLRAADTAIAQKNARALVEDWITEVSSGHHIGWSQEVIARRLLSWLSQSPMLLEDCEAEFYRRFMRSIYRQLRFLRGTLYRAPDGLPRLICAIAVVSGYACLEGQEGALARAQEQLDKELLRQILPDGGHASRHPGALLDILLDLLPLKQTLVMRGLSASSAMMEAIDRMMPMVRFFRHGDGSFAHFNGMGSTAGDVVATVLAYDDTRGAAPKGAPYSGYQRLQAGDALVLMDCGAPPPAALSSAAHAGCLSFEMSSRRNRLIVNCGVSARQRLEWRAVARSTAAHSTAGIGDSSSCHFLGPTRFEERIGTPVLSGPKAVNVERRDDEIAERVVASHDGYARDYHLLHERDLTLSRDGTALDGVDRFTWSGSKRGADYYSIRFHLHPQVRCSLVQSGSAVIMQCPDGESWEFSAAGVELALEESIYLSDLFGHRRTHQIVVYGSVNEREEVSWMMRRTAMAKGRRKSSGIA
ncbi:heparinase II/III family protein [Polycladidibacter hongkongensis]|uniref:heparinase II/III family protein n=1 Tax=Polycladidibacter hongkongensis TaxID=1647556 RepID=UPI000833EA46|nr:heparinase II/III family protein [Pseudovibrio hongkongensis]